MILSFTTQQPLNPIVIHKWRDRVLILHTPDSTHEVFKNQLNLFNKSAEGLKERDLVLYILENNNGYDHRSQLLTNKELSSMKKTYQPELDYYYEVENTESPDNKAVFSRPSWLSQGKPTQLAGNFCVAEVLL